jgi:AcrR family transcriptional regulator
MTDPEPGRQTTDAIMRATYRALCKHGYPETSMSNIAAEFEKSKSLLYYHYEDKADLLEDFLRFLLERFESDLREIDEDDPLEQVQAVLDRLLPASVDAEDIRFRRAILEMRSQAPYSPSFHEQFRRTDDLVEAEFAAAIERGIETGQFRTVDPERMAGFLYATAYGMLEISVTLDDPDSVERNRSVLDEYLRSTLLADES